MRPSIDIEHELRKFNHSVEGRVRFAEVDSFQVVHNLQYFYWLEWARTEYFRSLGSNILTIDEILKGPLVMVNQEINYFAPTKMDEEYKVLSRVTFIKNSSLGFENLILKKDNILSVKATAILVHFNFKENRTQPLPEKLVSQILAHEKDNCKILS